MQRAVHQEAAKQLSRHGSKQAVLESLRARNEYTKKYAKKQHKKAMADKQYQEQQGDLEMERHHFRTVTNVLMTARKAWREDWELGPLAPKRDIGVLAGLKYGSAALEHFAPSELESLALKRRKTRGELLRKYKVHDRVVVIAGKHKGRIGSLRDVNETNGYVRVNGINVVCLVFHSTRQRRTAKFCVNRSTISHPNGGKKPNKTHLQSATMKHLSLSTPSALSWPCGIM